jgi:hypothetical protein
MKKKNLNLANKILEYLRRNEKEQPIPAGFKSINDWCVILGCTRRMWGIMLHDLIKTTKVKAVKLKRVQDGKIRVMNFYKIDESFLEQIRKS